MDNGTIALILLGLTFIITAVHYISRDIEKYSRFFSKFKIFEKPLRYLLAFFYLVIQIAPMIYFGLGMYYVQEELSSLLSNSNMELKSFITEYTDSKVLFQSYFLTFILVSTLFCISFFNTLNNKILQKIIKGKYKNKQPLITVERDDYEKLIYSIENLLEMNTSFKDKVRYLQKRDLLQEDTINEITKSKNIVLNDRMKELISQLKKLDNLYYFSKV